MLGKLVKYDFRATAKTMVPIFGVMLCLSTVFALLLRLKIENEIIFSFMGTLLIATMVGSGIATVVCIARRFDQGLLKNEGYLSFALPVKTSTHIGAKLVNAVIWSVMETIAVAACIFIMIIITSSSEELVELVEDIMHLFGLIDRDIIIGLFKGLLIMMFELISSICMIYAAYAVAHLFDRHKSLVMGAFVVIVLTLGSTISTFLIDYTDIYFNELFWYAQAIVSSAIYLLITWFILDRRLNLE